ncbi:MAG: VOC family protein [Alphaproteobacteria bacterium]
MASPFLGLRTTIYKVPDIDVAKAWYAEAFGVAAYFDEPFYVGFNIAGYELGLMPDEGPAETKTSNVLSYWGVANVPDAIGRLVGLGATLDIDASDVGEKIIVATVKDPWGNAIGLIDNPHFKLP